MPNAAALAAEYVPRRQRPLAVTLAIVCVPLGGMLASWAADYVLPIRGWRALFLLGGLLPLLAVPPLMKLLPESPRYLARKPARRDELLRFLRRAGRPVPDNVEFLEEGGGPAGRVSLGALFRGGLARETLGLWLAFFSCLLVVYACFYWIPSLLAGAGLGQIASRGLLYFNLGGVLGAIVGAIVIGRVGSKIPMVALCGAAIAGVTLLALMGLRPGATVPLVLVFMAFAGTMINAVQTTLYALAAHVYPTAIRATGVGTAASIGRVGGLASTFLAAWVIEAGGSRAFFACLACVLCFALVGLILITRHSPRIPPASRT